MPAIRKLKFLLLAMLAIVAAYLLLWPIPIVPVAWRPPPSGGYQGPYARNDRLAAVRLLSVAPQIGPEHIAFGPDGKLYTGVLSGAILRMDPDGHNLETFVNTGGRPLGLDFDATGRLIVADALRGLLAVEPGGRVSVLEGALTQGPVEYADAVQVARDGRILFTDASRRLTPKKYGTFDAALLDILEHSCTGRVLEFDPSTSTTRTMVEGLCFPNGIALSGDEQHVLVAETGSYRIWRFLRTSQDLDAGAIAVGPPRPDAMVLIANLPGFPDNLTRDASGTFWTGLTKPRSDAIDRMAERPWLRVLMLRLPRTFWPVPPAYGHVVGFDADGRIVADLQDPAGKLPETSGATAHDGRLYVQSLHASALGVMELPPR